MVTEKIKNFLLAKKKYKEYKEKSKFFNKLPQEKSVLVRIKYPYRYHRYFYLVLKFYSLVGYSVYFPTLNFNYFRTKIWYRREKEVQHYFDLIFKEGLINIGTVPPLNSKIIELNEENVSPDYFATFFYPSPPHKYFHFPISMHPYMYHYNFWNSPIETTKHRKNTIYTFGNLSSENYMGFDIDIFGMPNRNLLIDFILKQTNVEYRTRVEDIHSYLKGDKTSGYFLFDGIAERIPMQEIRPLLSRFNFFLATPGVVMPQCHNLVEAISVGTIPIIDINYSRFLIPQLKHMHNAILYDGLEDLPTQVDLALSLNEMKVKEMRKKTLEYYQEYLTPKAVVRNIVKAEPQVMYLLAEHLSVNILKDKISQS